MSGAAKAAAKSNGTAPLRTVPCDREERFRAMFEGAAIGIGTCNLDGHILEGNAALTRMLGYTREELTGMNTRQLGSDDSHDDRQQVDLQRDDPLHELKCGTRDSIRQESRYRRKDGSYLWGRLTVSVVHDSGGEPAFLIALLEDTTEHQRAAEKSREAEKMEVIGRLAGGIAHDFNNLLTGVLLYCDLLSDGIEQGNPLLQHVEEIRLAGEQGAALTQQLLAIARKQVTQLQPILINDVVLSTQNLLGRLIGEHVELVTVLAPRLRMVLADQGQLRQVLLNLVLNARDAMPHGGRITVRTRAHRSVDGGPAMVSLLVEDTGCGMDEETRARLFEPFFTTKPPGHGTGLGLAMVQRIVSEAGGTIDVKSAPEHGTRFEVSLPAIYAVPDAKLPVKRSAAGETILLVDDHSSARNSMQRVLHHAGYRVLTASSGKLALKVFAECTDGVGLLIADWMMPGMSGRELAEKLREQKPDLKVLLVSGFHDSRERPPVDSVELIRKPFAGRLLLERIREVFDAKGDPSW